MQRNALCLYTSSLACRKRFPHCIDILGQTLPISHARNGAVRKDESETLLTADLYMNAIKILEIRIYLLFKLDVL